MSAAFYGGKITDAQLYKMDNEAVIKHLTN